MSPLTHLDRGPGYPSEALCGARPPSDWITTDLALTDCPACLAGHAVYQAHVTPDSDPMAAAAECATDVRRALSRAATVGPDVITGPYRLPHVPETLTYRAFRSERGDVVGFRAVHPDGTAGPIVAALSLSPEGDSPTVWVHDTDPDDPGTPDPVAFIGPDPGVDGFPPLADVVRLVAAIQDTIGPDDRIEGTDGDIPGVDITIGVDPERGRWGYQTGDNSFTGGAYLYPVWGVGSVTPDCDPVDVARELLTRAREAAAP